MCNKKMKRIRNISLFLAVISLLFLSGCVTLLEEITIREGGSGTLRIALGVVTEAYPQFLETLPEGYELENLLANLILDENVSSVQQDHYESEGRTWDTIQLDMQDVAVMFENPRAFGLMRIRIYQEEDVYTLEQILDMGTSNLRIPGVNLMDFSGAGFTVRLIAPQITDTNGIQTEAGVSIWEVSLSELLQGSETIYMEADYVLDPYEGVFIPWDTFFPYVVIGFLATGGITILVVIIVNTMSKKEKERKLQF